MLETLPAAWCGAGSHVALIARPDRQPTRGKHSRGFCEASHSPPDLSSCPLVPITPHHTFPQLSFPVCLFCFASSQSCSFLLVSLGKSLQCFLPKLGGELSVTVHIFVESTQYQIWHFTLSFEHRSPPPPHPPPRQRGHQGTMQRRAHVHA